MNASLPISVLLLARDEVDDLAALLPTLGFAAEVVMVWDPRGHEAARALGEQHGARVLPHPFTGFGAQRAFALAACTQPWVLWLDADERLNAVARMVLAAACAGPPIYAFSFLRETRFLGHSIRYCGWQRERVVRLFPRALASFDDAPVHEQVRLSGAQPGRLPGLIEHHSYRTWASCVEKPVRYAALAAARDWERGRRARLADVILRPPLRFLRQYVLQLGVLDGVHGWMVSALGAWQVFLKYGDLWARSRNHGR